MKILASDYDGTLNHGGQVSEDTIEQIRRWRAAGNLFGVVTGRGYSGIVKEMVHYAITYDFLLCHNGCVLYDSAGHMIEQAAADSEVLSALTSHIIDAGGLHVAISYRDERWCVIYPGQEGDGSQWWLTREQIITPPMPGFNQVDTHFHEEMKAKNLARSVNEQFSGKVTAHQNGSCVDIVPFGVDKPSGVRKYAARIGVTEKDVITVGDNVNDLGMLLAFDGYAMASGNPEVVRQAPHTCVSVAELIRRQF